MELTLPADLHAKLTRLAQERGTDPQVLAREAIERFVTPGRQGTPALMQLRWTEESANDLERIADYLLAHTPERAPELIHFHLQRPASLLTFPNRGRPGKKEGTRELVLAPLP